MKKLLLLLLLSNPMIFAGDKPTVHLRWESSVNTIHNVYRSNHAVKGYHKIGTVMGSEFTDKHVKKGKTYFYRVTTVQGRQESNPAEIQVNVPKQIQEKVFVPESNNK